MRSGNEWEYFAINSAFLHIQFHYLNVYSHFIESTLVQ